MPYTRWQKKSSTPFFNLVCPSVEKSIAGGKRVPIEEKCSRSHTGGVATPPGFAKPVVGCPHQRGATYKAFSSKIRKFQRWDEKKCSQVPMLPDIFQRHRPSCRLDATVACSEKVAMIEKNTTLRLLETYTLPQRSFHSSHFFPKRFIFWVLMMSFGVCVCV